jgi:hypothetical protein
MIFLLCVLWPRTRSLSPRGRYLINWTKGGRPCKRRQQKWGVGGSRSEGSWQSVS